MISLFKIFSLPWEPGPEKGLSNGLVGRVVLVSEVSQYFMHRMYSYWFGLDNNGWIG